MSYTLTYRETTLEQILPVLPNPRMLRGAEICALEGLEKYSPDPDDLLVLWHDPEARQGRMRHDLFGVFVDPGSLRVTKGHTVCYNGQPVLEDRLQAAGLERATFWD